ncbi:hypothetical protein NliqN6_1948 [Naganishia liquefaciens]|uniref:CUE domain-containing protein n=1 Tax=Naganishia liquefaciens TaxID=104408 RepID=A0A8H3TQI5_9TREE|nr:hypothetical protein NliqN6_1948 [Naganishia liquefaciens]
MSDATNNKTDARLLELQGMFPGIEAGVVQAVWEVHVGQGATEGDAWERAVEDLLQLSDPEYKPEPRPAALTVDAQTQTALDEEFARSLSMGREANSEIPYQPRSRRPHPQYPQQSNQESTYAYRGGDAAAYHPPSEGPGIEEKIEKFAQVGKQKFDLFLSRAKEKYNDMSEAAAQAQQQRQLQLQQQGHSSVDGKGHGDSPPQGLGYELANTLGGLWTGATAAVARGTQQPRQQGGDPKESASAPAWNDQAAKLTTGLGNAASGLKGWFDRTAGPKLNPGQEYPSLASSNNGRQSQAPSRRWQPTDVYEDESGPRSINVHHPSSSASSASSLPSTSDDDDAVALDEKDSTPRAASHLAGGIGNASNVPPPSKIDLSKIGMLPKKKVSLLPSPEANPSTSTLTGPTASTVQASKTKELKEEGEEEEYTKNPFEER